LSFFRVFENLKPTTFFESRFPVVTKRLGCHEVVPVQLCHTRGRSVFKYRPTHCRSGRFARVAD